MPKRPYQVIRTTTETWGRGLPAQVCGTYSTLARAEAVRRQLEARRAETDAYCDRMGLPKAPAATYTVRDRGDR